MACARFVERIESEIHGQAGGRPRDDTGTRFALWVVRGSTAGDSGVRIEAWLDSLALSRRSGEDLRSPDTDGIVGGRYRGVLSPLGLFTSSVHPFIPPEIAEFADLRGAFADVLPRLPLAGLLPGARWREGNLEIERLGDSMGSGGPLERFRLERHEARRETTLMAPGDTTGLAVSQTSAETGEFTWDADRGVVRRSRRISINTMVPAGKGLRYPVRSLVVQRVTLERLADSPSGCG